MKDIRNDRSEICSSCGKVLYWYLQGEKDPVDLVQTLTSYFLKTRFSIIIRSGPVQVQN